jgi:N-acetylglucosaminyldiphosphoundecaprenol N-acetyl-beta-D-mannosaminyltransferase
MIAVLRSNISACDYETAGSLVIEWAQARNNRYVCVANVHMLMEAYDSHEFSEIVNGADLVTPDGMPLVWIMRLKGQRGQSRVYGPALMLHVIENAAREHIPVGFYGSTPQVLESLAKRMKGDHAGLNIAFLFSPPYRDLDADEDSKVMQNIDRSGVRILFVGLGCPKQERWMAERRDKLDCVMIGVGAAFDFVSGAKSQAPGWMQGVGLEWFYRLVTEPGRLWRRYLYHNPRFVALAVADLLGFFR